MFSARALNIKMISTMLTFKDKARVSSEETQTKDFSELSAQNSAFSRVCSDNCQHRPSLIPTVGQHMLQTVEFSLRIASD